MHAACTSHSRSLESLTCKVNIHMRALGTSSLLGMQWQCPAPCRATSCPAPLNARVQFHTVRSTRITASAAQGRRPSVVCAGFQKPLTSAERKAKRADSQRLGKALVTVQLGQRGLTDSFYEGLAGALAANELVKVRRARQ